ncbi:hypothetical protein VP14_165 [Vibrio phage VPMCC14]|nr:hypothetical protein VP14_165 [Vibrio phage VPMCC14]
MKGTFTVIGSSDPVFYKGRVFWASEFQDNYNIKHYRGSLHRITNDSGLSIWVSYDRQGVKQ